MHYEWILILPMLLAVGCASQHTVVRQETPTLAMPPSFPAARTARPVETRYSVAGYREATAPDVRHEAHDVFRKTSVPTSLSVDLNTVPRETFPRASISELPESDELAAEITTQREITEELRNMKKAVADVQSQIEVRYATLVQQSDEVAKLRAQLEAENVRVRALRQTQINASTAAPPPVADSTEVRW